jgi:hypothetical protein
MCELGHMSRFPMRLRESAGRPLQAPRRSPQAWRHHRRRSGGSKPHLPAIASLEWAPYQRPKTRPVRAAIIGLQSNAVHRLRGDGRMISVEL